MAKITAMVHLDRISGKYHRTDKVYTRVRKFDNQIIGVALKNPVTNDPPSEGQAAAQQKLSSMAEQAKAIFADAEQLATYRSSWQKQKKIPTLSGYIYAQLYKQSNMED